MWYSKQRKHYYKSIKTNTSLTTLNTYICTYYKKGLCSILNNKWKKYKFKNKKIKEIVESINLKTYSYVVRLFQGRKTTIIN